MAGALRGSGIDASYLTAPKPGQTDINQVRRKTWGGTPGDAGFRYVLTTSGLTEHHTAGGMSRFLNHLPELQPEMFAESSPELARELKIKNGDFICIVSLRAAIEARALVSRRIRPLQLNGKTLHQVGVPFHFGTAGLIHGSAANDLLTISGEPNVTIMEAKALTCTIVP